MKYILTIHALENNEIVEISQEEYERCKNAKEYLFEALHIEEKVNIVIENYREFEMSLLDLTLKHVLYHDVNWSAFNENRNHINRKFANLLTACRIYLDHLMHHMSNIFGNSSKHIKEIEKAKSNQYDTELGYRIIDELRNYTQHRGFAISSLSYSSQWNEERTFITDTLIPKISILELEADKYFKKPSKQKIIEELKSFGNDIDIRPFVRTYVSSLGIIQEHVRNIIKEYSLEWEDLINKMIEKYPSNKDKSNYSVGLVIAIMRNDGTYGDVIYLFREYIQRWKKLEQLNSQIKHLPKRNVTNK